jgi:site-specific recombinase XerD
MARVRLRSGLKAKTGEQLVLYSARHTFATETSGAISDIELAELLGQTDTRTTRRYVHFNVARLREIQRRAQAGRLRVPENA